MWVAVGISTYVITIRTMHELNINLTHVVLAYYCTCVCVFTRVCFYTCVFLHVRGFTRECFYTCVFLHVRVFRRACLHTCVFTHVSVYTRVCLHTCGFTHVWVYIRVCLHTCVFSQGDAWREYVQRCLLINNKTTWECQARPQYLCSYNDI